MYYISLCISIPNSVPLSIGPTLLQRVRALRHSVTTRHSPSLSVIFRHAPSRSVTSLHFPSLRFIFRLHFIFRHPLPFFVFTVILVMFRHLDMIPTPIS